jgi:hypothetical protein
VILALPRGRSRAACRRAPSWTTQQLVSDHVCSAGLWLRSSLAGRPNPQAEKVTARPRRNLDRG